MNDLISRSRLIEEMKNDLALKYTGDVTVNFINGMIARQNEIIDIINDMPTVEAVPVVRGEWIGGTWYKECSVCSEVFAHTTTLPNFCPRCGADMRKKVQYEQI